MDGTRVDVGDDHMDDYPTPGRFQQVLAPLPQQAAPAIPGQRPSATGSAVPSTQAVPQRRPVTAASDEQGPPEEAKD